ncbi:Pentatricopeptide repeat-containing protein [Raphanus sativus]|nr:Pentatricopeptide repeat-containing protein [Raphanus sativus]
MSFARMDRGYAIGLSRLLRLAKLRDKPEAIEEAKFVKLFHDMSVKNPETWCVMMRCLVSNGYGDEAIGLFTRFKQEGNKPDGEIFKQVFSAYTLTGDVKNGLLQFEAMQRDYGIKPSMEHYNSVTKMLATSGHLDEALSFVEKMPVEPSVDVWETLMNFSRVHGDVELGDRCAEMVDKLDATRLDEASSAGLVANVNYIYRTKDTSHPETDMIYETLKSLHLQMLEMGYVPSTKEWRNELVEKANREEWTFGYKEEVAVVKKLLDSRPRSPVTVISNFRICLDCHDALKFMSKITGRELIKRDSKRFHRFSKGICSCNDYW